MRLTMGGEPTFVSIDDLEVAGMEYFRGRPDQARRSADDLIRRLRTRFAPGGLLHFGQGKWYPGESLPRWAFGLYWRKDGVPIWKNSDLIAKMRDPRKAKIEDAERFAEARRKTRRRFRVHPAGVRRPGLLAAEGSRLPPNVVPAIPNCPIRKNARGWRVTASPRLLVLDAHISPRPAAAEEVLSALARLVHDLGLTVVMAEHRLERVVPFADRIVLVPGDGAPLVVGPPESVMRTSPVAPPLVELGRLVAWDPLPLSVRDARRSRPRSARLARSHHRKATHSSPPPPNVWRPRRLENSRSRTAPSWRSTGWISRSCPTRCSCSWEGRFGKSTLLNALSGVRRPTRGAVAVDGPDPQSFRGAELVRHVGLVPQDPGLLLYGESVQAECEAADKASALAAGTTARTLDRRVARPAA